MSARTLIDWIGGPLLLGAVIFALLFMAAEQLPDPAAQAAPPPVTCQGVGRDCHLVRFFVDPTRSAICAVTPVHVIGCYMVPPVAETVARR